MQGQRIDSYLVGRLLGQGGMGSVHEAKSDSGPRVAIKLLLPSFAGNPEINKRFFNEARALNLIEHPGIVKVFDFGKLPGGSPYIIMEYIDGEPLSRHIRQLGGLGSSAVHLGRQIAEALAHAHGRQIIHRDLKPGNIMVVPDPEGERIKLLDFGIAKLAEEYRTADSADYRTRDSAVLGTAAYMSPEQCLGAGKVTEATDVYALGVTLYHMLVGQPPFQGPSDGALITMHLLATPAPLRDLYPGIPAEVADLVHAMLAKDPLRRPSMTEVAEALSQLSGLSFPGPPQGSVHIPQPLIPSPPQESNPSTLGQGTGQRLRHPGGRRAHPLLLFASLWAALISTGTAWLLLRTARQRPVPIQAGQGAAAITQPAPPVPPVVPRPFPAPRVRWSITTEPRGAWVVRLSDGHVLGTTPWTWEQPAAAGKVVLVLRHTGYADRRLLLDQAVSEVRKERLVPPFTKRHKKTGGPIPTEEIDDFKRLPE